MQLRGQGLTDDVLIALRCQNRIHGIAVAQILRLVLVWDKLRAQEGGDAEVLACEGRGELFVACKVSQHCCYTATGRSPSNDEAALGVCIERCCIVSNL